MGRYGSRKMNTLSSETIELLQTVVDETWDALRPEEKLRTSRERIAARLFDEARAGERDPLRLRIAAIEGVVTSAL